MDWYAGSGVGVKLAVIGWHSGVLGKLVFFIGLAVLALVALRESGFELPPTVPDSLLVLALGALALIFVLIRLISIPDSVLPADGRGIGIYISLLASLGVILGGLLRAAEELLSAPRGRCRRAQAGTSCFARSISCCGSNGLPMNAARAALLGIGRRSRGSTWPLEHDHRDRAVALLHPLQHLPAVDARHDDVEQDELGRLVLDHRERLLGARRLADRVALHLEVDAHELAQARVVVDDEHERARPLAAGAGAVEEQLEVAAAVAAVAARRVERRHAALVGPLADRRLGDAEELGRLAERQPVGLASSVRVCRGSVTAKSYPKLKYLNRLRVLEP